MKIYINGVHIATADRAFVGPIHTLVADLVIGRDPKMTIASFHGSMDEIRLYDRTLSETTIQFHFSHPGQ